MENTASNQLPIGYNLFKFFIREMGRGIVYYGSNLNYHIDNIVKVMNLQGKDPQRHRVEEYMKKINTIVFEMAKNRAVFNFDGMEEFSDIAEFDFAVRLKEGIWLTWFTSHNFWCSHKKELMNEFGLSCQEISSFFDTINPLIANH